jgi:hypothetical protein
MMLTDGLQGEAVRKRIGAVAYLECSTETGEGCEEALRMAVVALLDHEKKQEAKKRTQLKGLFGRLFQV